MEGHPPPRRRPPGRLPEPLPRQRRGSRGHSRVSARRRRAIDRLERHRSHGYAIRPRVRRGPRDHGLDRKSTRLNSSHANISYAVFCLKKKQAETVMARALAITLADEISLGFLTTC